MGKLLVSNGISAVYTRTGDYAPGRLENKLNQELNYRVEISDAYEADLFVSIHINAGGGTGAEVLISSMGGRAEMAANKVLKYLVQTGEWANRGVKAQNVLVLNRTKAPAILTESGFIDSLSDASKLRGPDFVRSLAVAHAKGICDYFGITYKEEVSKVAETVTPKKIIAVDDTYLTVRVRESLADQAIRDINKLGFAAKKLELA